MPDNKNNTEGSIPDEDPTLELEPLNLEQCAGFGDVDDEPVQLLVSKREWGASGHAGNAATPEYVATEIDELREELKFRIELNNILKLGNDQLRERCDMLEEQVAQLKKTVDSLALERSRGHADTTREDRDDFIAGLQRKNLELTRVVNGLQEKLDAAKTAVGQVIITDPGKPSGHTSSHRETGIDKSSNNLALVDASGSGSRIWLLNAHIMSIGSGPDCDIHLESRFVSRQHARLLLSPQGCVVEDLNSTNGTYINARRIRKRSVQVGDLITFGKYRFRIEKQSTDPSMNCQSDFDTQLRSSEM